jgi:hypothetical protein
LITNFEELADVVAQINAKRESAKIEAKSHIAGKDFNYVKHEILGAIGWVGLEFDQVDQIKNLIDEITEVYNNRVIDYLESALSSLNQLRFCSLPIQNELEECIAAVYNQNRSLKEYVSQLDDYVRLVNETEDSIVEQLSTIQYDYVIPGQIPVYIPNAQQVTAANGSAITWNGDPIYPNDNLDLVKLGNIILEGGATAFQAYCDAKQGAKDAVLENVTWGATEPITEPFEPNTFAYKSGKVIGDVASAFIGGAEIAGGAGLIAGGGAIDASVVVVPGAVGIAPVILEVGTGVAVAGSAVAGAGGVTVIKSADSLNDDVRKLVEKSEKKSSKVEVESGNSKGAGTSKGAQKIDKQRKGTPGNNQAQNKQTRDVANKYKLNKEQQRQLHDEVTGQNYTYKEIEEIAKEIKEGR